jgi:prepilin-type N-terminal cleavage/methylation domain-containing protein
MKRAFTLVELLIVIAILAVLLGLSMPALAKARRKSLLVQCGSNQRQLAIALILYANDNNGTFPKPGENFWFDDADFMHWQTCPPYNRTIENSRLWPYLKGNTKVLLCPADDVAAHRNVWGVNPPLIYPFSYSLNTRICRLTDANGKRIKPSTGPSLKLNQVRRPSQVFLVADESEGTMDDGCLAWQPELGAGYNMPSIRHDRPLEQDDDPLTHSCLMAFADCHVEMITRREFFDPSGKHYDPRK